MAEYSKWDGAQDEGPVFGRPEYDLIVTLYPQVERVQAGISRWASQRFPDETGPVWAWWAEVKVWVFTDRPSPEEMDEVLRETAEQPGQDAGLAAAIMAK